MLNNIKDGIETAYNWARYFTALVIVVFGVFMIVPMIAKAF